MYIVRDQLHCYAASFAACAAALLLLLCCVAAGACCLDQHDTKHDAKCHCAEIKEGTVRSREPSKFCLDFKLLIAAREPAVMGRKKSALDPNDVEKRPPTAVSDAQEPLLLRGCWP
eukprot:8919-Heterococcus_DN1.PRE.2